MDCLYFRKWVFMAGAVVFLTITGCEDSDRITQVEKAVKEQEKKVEQNRADHSELEGSVGSVKKELETLKERVAVLEKKQAETKVRLDELWTDDVDKSTFEKWKSGLTVPAVRVQRVSKPPVMDGKLDDLYKTHAVPMKFFRIEKIKPDRSGDSLVKAYVVIGPKAMYVAAHIETTAPPTLHSSMTKRDSSLWDEESIDMFIGPNADSMSYYHVISNVIGTLYDAQDSDTSWNPAITVKCRSEGEKGWVMEMKIPLKEMEVKTAEIKKIWSFNITYFCPSRDQLHRDTDLAWSPTGASSSHVPERFGFLWMAFTGRPDPKELKRDGY